LLSLSEEWRKAVAERVREEGGSGGGEKDRYDATIKED
jgi:hypothetical protein